MLRLVKADLATARKRDLRDGAPARLLDRSARDPAPGEGAHLCPEVVAHEIEPRGRWLGRVYRALGRRQCEDQPSTAGVDRVEAEDVRQERTVRLGVRAVE